MEIYIVYEWYADSDDDSCHIEKRKDIAAVYDSLQKAEKHIEGKNTSMQGLWSDWYTIEQYKVR